MKTDTAQHVSLHSHLCEICRLPMSSSPVPAVTKMSIFFFLCAAAAAADCFAKALKASNNSEASPIDRAWPTGDKNLLGAQFKSASVTGSSSAGSAERQAKAAEAHVQ